MKCQKCGNEISNQEAICPKCNYKNDVSYLKYLQDDQVKANLLFYNENKESFKNQATKLSISSASSIYVEPNFEYLIAYIGDNYESFQKGGFSFCSFFFGDYYLIYRKLYLFWILRYLVRVVILLSMLVLYFSPSSYSEMIIFLLLFFEFLIEISPCFFIKSIYYKYASSKVEQILNNNSDKNKEELLEICRKKGGTSILSVVIFFTVFSFFSNFLTSIYNDVKKVETRVRDLSFQTTSYLDLDSNYQANFSYTRVDECYIAIATERKYSESLEQYIEEDISKTNLSIETINNHIWKHYKDGDRNYYYAENKEFYYKLTTEVINDNLSCKKAIDTVMDSLEFE